MRHEPGESLDSWTSRVQLYEYGLALQALAKGQDPESVMVLMSRRIMDKLLHPAFDMIQPQETGYDPVKARQQYKEVYLDRVGLRADHVLPNTY